MNVTYLLVLYNHSHLGSHDSIRTVHHRDVQEDSMKSYSVIVTCLVSFTMRCYRGWESGYTMTLNDTQRTACKFLEDELRRSHSRTGVDAELHDPTDEQDWYSCVQVAGQDEHEDSDIDEYEDDGASHKDEPTAMAHHKITDNSLQSCILDLLVSLYTQLPTGNDDKFFSPILRFAVLASLQSSGKWLEPRRITHILAVLLFCGREVMMALMHQQLVHDPTIRYSKCVVHLLCIVLISESTVIRAFQAIASFLDDAQEGPIPSMYLLMRPLNCFATAEEGSLRFTAVDFSGDNIIVAGQVLYLRDIRRFVEILISEIKEHIQKQLFFGLNVVDINWSPGIIHEEPRNLSVRYSCFCDAHNDFAKHKNILLRLVLTHPHLRGHFHYIDAQGRVVWKAASCFEYMQSCHTLEMMLFSGTQTTVGEPARGTEIASHRLENVSGGTLRNVLVMFQYFCMMGTYNKTSHLTERDVNMM